MMYNSDMYKVNTPEEDVGEIQEFLDDHGVKYDKVNDNHFIFRFDDENKRGYEICYVSSLEYPIAYPQYNIEGVDKAYFYNESKKAEDSNSFKCWVKDFEWRDDRKREVLKSYFLHAAGKTPHKFYARECEVREVPTKLCRQFESVNCFYGKRGASLSLGLYTKKEKHGVSKGTLIMVYTFGINFFGKDRSIEVLRVGTKKFAHVAGGASKLMKHFIKNYPTMRVGETDVVVKKIKFYSDYDHNIGSSLNSNGLGFNFVSYSGGGFMNYWIETGEVKGRQPMKHKWVMKQMAEGECISVPNAGVKTYVLEVDRTEEEIQELTNNKEGVTLESFF